MRCGARRQGAFAEDNLPVDGAGHKFHRAGVGRDRCAHFADVIANVLLGGVAESHIELAKALAENPEKFIRGEVLEHKRVVELKDAGL